MSDVNVTVIIKIIFKKIFKSFLSEECHYRVAKRYFKTFVKDQLYITKTNQIWEFFGTFFKSSTFFFL